MPNSDEVWREIISLFTLRGDNEYFGEPVSQAQHALQCARLASAAGAAPAVITAALLHDVGHLLHNCGEDIADRGVDAQHETLGHRWLAARFGPHIAETVRLHVDAKRYLTAVEADYAETLSPASRQSLQLQGGPMTEAEQAVFCANPASADALTLRRWDDAAKDPLLEVPPLSSYEQVVKQCVQTERAE
jgi:phosphonate degradation associated HDIG domain protein